MPISRREFLDRFGRTTGCFIASASLSGLAACGREDALEVSPGTSARYSFPEGIASADPQPDAVVLWTRIIDQEDAGLVRFTVQMSADESFSEILVQQSLEADASLDFTVRCFVEGLDSNSWYWYRFVTPDGYSSRIGRTHTAPEENTEARLNLAVFSCQNYEHGFFNAYRRLILDDQQRPESERVQLCLHVGDFIYESVNDRFASIDGVSMEHRNRDGASRRISALPSGGREDNRGLLIPVTLDDYRHIYRRYLHDESLLEARALYPFTCIWDDHEVINDYWQSYGPNGPMQKQKVAANQAWFEFIPAALSYAQPGPAGINPARDFEPVEVDDVGSEALDDNYLSHEANNQAAIDSLTIYRSLKWGRDIDLFLVDGRSYRGERGVDNSLLTSGGVAAYPSAPLDPALIRTLNAGRTANEGSAPETVSVRGVEQSNPRQNSPYGSLLGQEQKLWLKESLAQSEAKWKLICNNVPMLRFGFDNAFQQNGHKAGVYYTDSWDGYPIERTELMSFILDGEISNVVSLTGDRHANFAGLIYNDYDSPQARPAAVELVGTSVSAGCRFKLMRGTLSREPELDVLGRCDGQSFEYFYNEAPVINGWMLFGSSAARSFSTEFDVNRAMAAADPEVNPHLSYADNDAYGYFRVSISGDALATEFVVLPEPVDDYSQAEPPVRRRVFAQIPSWQETENPEIRDWRIEGEAPLLGIKL